MLMNLFDTFITEVSKEENKEKINNVVKPYINHFINSISMYVIIIILVLLCIFFMNVYLCYVNIKLTKTHPDLFF